MEHIQTSVFVVLICVANLLTIAAVAIIMALARVKAIQVVVRVAKELPSSNDAKPAPRAFNPDKNETFATAQMIKKQQESPNGRGEQHASR